MATKKQEIVPLTEEQIADLDSAFPVGEPSNNIRLPRFGMLAKDITEETGSGKTKKINIIQTAGTFYTERDSGEVNDEGKKVWTREYLEGETVDVIIAYYRYQLRKYDSSLKKFISSPIFDNKEQVIPLFLDKQVIAKGTKAELQARYPALTQKGKPTSDLKEETILYIIYNGELFQMNLTMSSGWKFSDYKNLGNPSKFVTTMFSMSETNGSNTYSKTMFKRGRMINGEEFPLVKDTQTELDAKVLSDKQLFLASGPTEDEKRNSF